MLIILLLILIQIGDSFCAELYDKIQSLYLKDLLMVPQNISLEEATIMLNQTAIPFGIIAALAPMARVLVDYIGKKKVFLISFVVLCSGLVICMTTSNWLLFLLGNSLVSFGCSVDIQYIYIVDKFEENRRGTIRGVLAAVAALSGIGVALIRNPKWRGIYLVGIIVVSVVMIVTMLLMPKEKVKTERNKTVKAHTEKATIKGVIGYLIPLFIWGIGVSGVTFYNEPIATLTLNNEQAVKLAMFCQPLVTVIITLLSGYMSDRLSRKKIICMDIGIGCVGVLVFVIMNITGIDVAPVMGIAWGMMVGGYFAATNLMLLVITELAPRDKIGRVSALASYVNGAGTAVGMVLISILSNFAGTGIAKLLITAPVCLITIVSLFILQKKTAC